MNQLEEIILDKKLRGKRLKTLAKFINKHLKSLTAEIQEGYCNTDRHISGTRLKHIGKGRYGNMLIVKNEKGEIIYRHNAAETYRENREVVSWIIKKLSG